MTATDTKSPDMAARPVQRITKDHDEMVRSLAASTGRTRQAIVNDALDAGLGLVLLDLHDPVEARATLAAIQRRLNHCMTTQAALAAAVAAGAAGAARALDDVAVAGAAGVARAADKVSEVAAAGAARALDDVAVAGAAGVVVAPS